MAEASLEMAAWLSKSTRDSCSKWYTVFSVSSSCEQGHRLNAFKRNMNISISTNLLGVQTDVPFILLDWSISGIFPSIDFRKSLESKEWVFRANVERCPWSEGLHTSENLDLCDTDDADPIGNPARNLHLRQNMTTTRETKQTSEEIENDEKVPKISIRI